MALWGDAASSCPVGGPQCAANTTSYAKLFSTGMIPTQDFSPISQKLVTQFVPLPNRANNGYNFTAVQPGKSDLYGTPVTGSTSAPWLKFPLSSAGEYTVCVLEA